MIDEFTKGDRTKFDYYYRMNIFEFLNHFSYVKDKLEMKKENV